MTTTTPTIELLPDIEQSLGNVIRRANDADPGGDHYEELAMLARWLAYAPRGGLTGATAGDTPAAVRGALREVLDHYTPDEAKDYRASDSERRDGHVYEALVELGDWLDGTGRQPLASTPE